MDTKIRIWDLIDFSNLKYSRTLDNKHNTCNKDIICINLIKKYDHTFLLGGYENGYITAWNTNNWNQISQIKIHQEAIWDLNILKIYKRQNINEQDLNAEVEKEIIVSGGTKGVILFSELSE